MLFSKCKCCDTQIEVNTIDTMLLRAYTIIDRNSKITQLLNDLNIDKYTVGISQEFSRQKSLSDPHSNFLRDYRCIQESQAGIYLGFNENFTVLEVVEISTEFFSDNHIRGYKAQFNSLSNKQKLDFLQNAFSKYDSKLKDLNYYIKVKYIKDIINTQIVLKLPNDRLSNNAAYAFFPNRDNYPYFTFDINRNKKDGRLNSIRLNLCSTNPIKEPISKWLHQFIITMSPDYAEVFLWFDDAAGGLESIEEYVDKQSELAKKIENWQKIFESSFLNDDTDWIEFDRTGKEIFLELRDKLKKDYILTYEKSYEECCGSNGEEG